MAYFNDRRNNKRPINVTGDVPAPPVTDLMRDQALSGGILYPGAQPLMNPDLFANTEGVAPLMPGGGGSYG